LTAVFRILRDVLVYRIRKREMANLASSFTIMMALGLPSKDVAVRMVFAVALNFAVYLTNDIHDVEADLAAPDKDHDKASFLHAHRAQAWFALLAPLSVMVLLGAWWAPELLITLVVAGSACWAYSARLKRLAFVDLPTILVCGVAGSMVAFPLDRSMGWCLAGLLGLFAACFQTVQMIRDHDADAAFGTQTTAVTIGPKATVWLQRALLVGAAVYAALVVHRWIGSAMVLVAAIPFDPQRASAHWNRIRAALGLAWLAIIGWIIGTGSTHGWLVQLERASVAPW